MQNTIAKSSQPAQDGYERVEMEGDATDEELLITGASRLFSSFINAFRRIPENGRMTIDWQKKSKSEKRHYSMSAKAETIDHTGAVVVKKTK